MLAGVSIIATGVANIFLIKMGKKLEEGHKLWVHFFELKFVLSLFLTPAINPLLFFILGEEADEYEKEELKIKIQFGICAFFLFYSVFARQFREEDCLNFEQDPMMHRMRELQQKYERPKEQIELDRKKRLEELDAQEKKSAPRKQTFKEDHTKVVEEESEEAVNEDDYEDIDEDAEEDQEVGGEEEGEGPEEDLEDIIRSEVHQRRRVDDADSDQDLVDI